MTHAIRPLAAADHAQWLALWRAYCDFYEVSLPPEVTAETWRRLIDPKSGVDGFCAVDDAGRLSGIVHYLFHPVTWAIEPRCYLEDLFVSEVARGQGVGEALIDAVAQEARACGSDQVYWLTRDNNARARKLYDRIATATDFIKYRL